jgi:hypothetical protein
LNEGLGGEFFSLGKGGAGLYFAGAQLFLLASAGKEAIMPHRRPERGMAKNALDKEHIYAASMRCVA